MNGSQSAQARRIGMSTLAEPISAPFKLPDRYEVVNGKIKELPPMGAPQVGVASRLNGFIFTVTHPKNLGTVVTEMMFRLKEGKPQRRPDVAFVSAERWPVDEDIPAGEAWLVVPNLAVEVVSPSNTFVEIDQKILEYFDAGVKAVWVIATETRRVHVYDSPNQSHVLGVDETLLGDPVLPGFKLPLHELFPGRRK
jgi:Uma2 family endonuclease